jgi:hypothetical protein
MWSVYRRVLPASLAGAAMLCVVPAWAADDPAAIVQGWIAEAEAFEWLSVTHEGVSHDAASGRTVVSGLSLAVEMSDLPGVDDSDAGARDAAFRYVFTFPELVFEGLEADDRYYSARAMRADVVEVDFTVESAEQGVTNSTGAYNDIAVENPRWARLPAIEDDPARPISRFYPLAAALVDVSFDEARLGGLDLVTENAEPAMVTTMHYGPSRVGRTERGNMSSMTMGEVIVTATLADEDVAMSAFEMSIGGMEADAYNYGDMVRLFDPELEPGSDDAPFQTMAKRVSARDWSISSEGVEFTMGDMLMEDLGGRLPTQPLLARADSLYLQAVEDGGEPDAKEIGELVAAFYGAFRLGLMEMRDASASAEGFSGTLKSAGLAGLSSRGIDSIYYRGLEAGDGGEVQVRLGDLTISALGFPSLAALIAFEQAQEQGDVATMLAAIPTLGGILISDLLVQVPFMAEVSLARSALEMTDHIGPIPTRIRSSVENLRMPTWMLDEDSREVFDGLGYEEIDASQEIDLAWREADETLSLNSSATLGSGGSLFLDATLGGLPREVFENPMSAPFMVFMLSLNEAGIRFVDDSLTERALTMLGAQQGMDADTMRAQAMGIIPFMLAALQRPDFLMAATAATKSFLDEPGTIRIDMRPDEPVPITALMEASETDPGLIIDLLNVEISAE